MKSDLESSMKSDEVFKRLEMYNFIGGQFVRSGAKEEISIIEPATEARIGSVADTTDGEINEAVARANDAQREWRKRDAMHRAEALHELARRLRERGPVIAEI